MAVTEVVAVAVAIVAQLATVAVGIHKGGSGPKLPEDAIKATEIQRMVLNDVLKRAQGTNHDKLEI